MAALLLASPAGTAAAASWSVEANGLLALPVSPSAFGDSWGGGWGLAGSVHRTAGARMVVGIEGSFVQFGLAELAGEDVSGGARRWSSLRIPVRYYLWEDRDGSGNFALTASAGYTHQFIEPISNAEDPPPSGNADGFAWSAGVRYSHPLRELSRVTLGLEYGAAHLEHETPGALTLRVGITTPLSSTPH
jgi:hypothetical protein